MTDDLYREQLLEESSSPQYFGVMENPDLVVHERNASCGDEITLFLQFSEPKKPLSLIKALSWTGAGCAISRASMSVLAGKVLREKLTLPKVAMLTKSDLEKLLGIENISPGRLKCLLLGLQTFKKALESTSV